MPQTKGKSGEKAIEKIQVSGWKNKLFKVVVEVADRFRTKVWKRDLPDSFFKNRDFFEHVGFFKDLQSSYPYLEIIKDEKNKKVRLKGRGDEFFAASNKCDNAIIKLMENREEVLKDARMWDIIHKNYEYVNKIMASKKIKAKVCFTVLVSFKIGILHLECSRETLNVESTK